MTAIPPALAPEFVAAGHAYNIPPAVLAGVAQVESAFGRNRGPSSAGAIGLMQFMPGTASDLGINPRNDHESIWGAAKLLNQYGYQRDPVLALSNYNAGPAATGKARAQGNAYANTVMSAANSLFPELAGVTSSPAAPAAASSAPSVTASSNGGDDGIGAGLVQLLLTVVLGISGAVLAYTGARQIASSSSAWAAT